MDPVSILTAIKLALQSLAATPKAFEAIDALLAKVKSAPKSHDVLAAQLVESEVNLLQKKVAEFSRVAQVRRFNEPEKEEARLRLAHQLLHTIQISRGLFQAHGVNISEIESFCESLIRQSQ